MFASGFSWFHLIFPEAIGNDSLIANMGPTLDGGTLMHGASGVIPHAWLACGLVVAVAVFARMGLEKAKARNGLERYHADSALTARTAMEVVVEAWLGLLDDLMPKAAARQYFPLIGSYFMYIFACNILGIFPGFIPPTDNVNTNVGMAVASFVIFMFIGLTGDAVGFVKHMMGNLTKGPILAVGLFLLCVESISFAMRPVSLTLRLTGNMFGDHTVFAVVSDLFPPFAPVPFLILAMFVSFMQAFVFSLLTATYIAGALPHGDDHH